MQHMNGKKTACRKGSAGTCRKSYQRRDAYEKKLAKSPDDPELWLDYIQFFNMKGNRRKEEDTIRRALKQFPDDKNLLLRYDDVRRERARIELARIQEQMQKDPTDAMKQKFAEAKKVFDEASLALIERKLAANPNSTAVRFEYGRFLMAQDRFQEAIAELQKAHGMKRQSVLSSGDRPMLRKDQTIQTRPYALRKVDRSVRKRDRFGRREERSLLVCPFGCQSA